MLNKKLLGIQKVAAGGGGGGSSAVVVVSPGPLYTWGSGAAIGQTGPLLIPKVLGTNSWAAISAGYQHTAAIRSDGALFTWGLNGDGRLGDNTITTRSSPVQIGTSSWTAVSAGKYHTLAIRSDAGLFAWGYAGDGAIGDGTLTNQSSPVQIGTNSWTVVSASKFRPSSFGIQTNGSLWVWGQNGYGQLGTNNTTRRLTPFQLGTSSWTAVSSFNHTLAIRSDGGLFSWGGVFGDALGQGGATTNSPVQVGTSSWSAVGAGGFSILGFSVGLTSDKRLFTWGNNNYGQLGDGTTTAKSSPVQIGTSSWTTVSAGFRFMAAIKSNGALFTWGDSSAGKAGTGGGDTSSPVQVGTSSWSAVNAGGSHAVGITVPPVPPTPGLLFTWGVNNASQLGDGTLTRTDQSSPIQIGTLSWVSLSEGCNQFSKGAIRSDGALFTWGFNWNGEIGDGTSGIERSSPVQIGTSSWTAVSMGGQNGATNPQYTMAIRKDGALFSWGWNNKGQLGDGTVTPRSSPVQVGTSSWTTISASTYTAFAIKSDGALFAWGFNSFGRLGLGDTTNRSSPTQIGTSSWTTVSAGTYGGAAIRSDGALFAWGYGGYGTIGDGTLTTKSSPVQIGTSSWTTVSAGEFHIIAIKKDSGLYAWGLNNKGQVGDGTTANKSSPVQIGTSSWTLVSGGNRISQAIRLDGALFVWGYNASGRLGLGDTPNRSSPTQIGTSSWVAVKGGFNSAAGLKKI